MSYYNFKSEKDYAIYWMNEAIKRARKALSQGEVPIGALIVKDNKLIASGYNKKEKLNLATAHAEVLAINQACRKLNSWRLVSTHMFVTMEPGPMCTGAMIQARVSRLYFGCFDPKGGAVESNWNLHNSKYLNHRIEVIGGVLESECGSLIKDFFFFLWKENKKNK